MPQTSRASAGSDPLCDELRHKSRKRRSAAKALAMRPPHVARRNDLLPRLALVQRPAGELHYPKRNVRRADALHIREVADAISTLGFCQPVLIDATGRVIDGVVRVEAARLLGLAEVPCLSLEHLTPAEVRVLRLAVNRLGEKGAWDLDALKVEFEELMVEDGPVEIAGFDLDEIDQICLDGEPDGLEPGVLEPQPEAVAVARVGDCFKLGAHRLICGDATDPSVLERLLQGDSEIRLVATDEPYNVKVTGHVSRGGHREFPMASGEMSGAEFLTFNTDWMTLAAARLCDGGVLATFCDWRAWPTVHQAATALGLAPINLVVWAKTNGGMGSLYRSQHELLPLFKSGLAPHVNNVKLGAKGRWRSNVWTYPGASSLGSDARQGLKNHPTVKPVSMIEDALLDLTHRGDLVLDPFLGSGTTLLAAESTGRVCRGLELDPLYVDVIIRRFQAATGKVVVLEGPETSFEDLTAQRLRAADPENPVEPGDCRPDARLS